MVPAGDADRADDRRARRPPGRGRRRSSTAATRTSATRSAAARELAEQGIGFVDAGTSGGVWGLENGYAPDGRRHRRGRGQGRSPSSTRSPRRTGSPTSARSGAGHYTKMVHNGIEYGMMQAYAEGFAILARRPSSASTSLAAVEVVAGGQRRAVVAARPAGARRSTQTPDFEGIRGVAADSGEGRWTVNEAVRLGVAAPVISAALFARFVSQDEDQLDDEGHRRAAPPVRRPRLREGDR